MGNSFSSQELKTRLFDDLMIDLAFPFFPAGRKTGSAACCVVTVLLKRNEEKHA
jgi:hypothetical protein